MGLLSLITGKPGPSGFGSASTAEQVTEGIDASHLTAIVTGGASGIGAETVRVLALRGAHVIIAARNLEAANNAKQLILKENGAARVDVLKLDLCSLKSVREFADSFLAMDLPLNILLNNAGVMFCPYQLSEDGIEMQFATNYLGHFLLTSLLLEKMKRTARETGVEGRIVNLSSIAHLHTYEEGIQFDKINEQSGYSDKKAYGQSKLAIILHANELSRRLQRPDSAGVLGLPLEVGETLNTQLHYISGGRRKCYHKFCPPRADNDKFDETFLRFNAYEILKVFTYIFWKNVPQGAATSCYVALHPSVKGVTGTYFLDCNKFTASPFATNEELAKKLWDFSNKLINSAEQKA